MTNRQRTRVLMISMILSLALPWVLMAESGHWNTNSDNVILDGYDVVAYHKQDAAVRGSARLSTEYEGAKFYFSNSENLDAFRANPTKYAPKFGGFCAFGVAAKKAKAPTDPQTFKLYNGELLFFFNDLFEGQQVNTKIMWNQNEGGLYSQAVSNWLALK